MADDVVDAMQAVGAIASKAATPAQVAASPHLAARDYWQSVTGANGTRRILGPPFRMSATRWQVRGEAPSLPDTSTDDAR
jgi:crotonobetainyl-CoA:carnitine CoA-transferase CaiB-like acyl-CoA transferase